MKIESLENGYLRVWLSDVDLKQLGVSFDTLDIHRSDTRQALLRVLTRVYQTVPAFSENILSVEALPLAEGCLLLLSPHQLRQTGGLRSDKTMGPYIYKLNSTDDLLQFGKSISHCPALPPASLYRHNTVFFLILYSGFGNSKALCRCLSEFADDMRTGDAAAAYVAEQSDPVIIGNALQRLIT